MRGKRRAWLVLGLAVLTVAMVLAGSVATAYLFEDRPPAPTIEIEGGDDVAPQPDPPVDPKTLEPREATAELTRRCADAKEGDTIRLPVGAYGITGNVVLPTAKHVTVDATGSVFRGRAVLLAVGSEGLTWRGGTFIGDGTNATRIVFNLFKARNIAFEGIEFDRAIDFGNHAFDLMGCDGVLIDWVIFRGYGDSKELSRTEAHNRYAEAVQVDVAAEDATGNETTANLIREYGGVFDRTPSMNVTVQNSSFLPASDASGALITWAQTPFGSHSYSGSGAESKGLQFSNNTVRDPLPIDETSGDRWLGALHFASVENLRIANNRFFLSEDASRSVWIQLEQRATVRNPLTSADVNVPSRNIHVVGNRFFGAAPGVAYLLLNAPIDHDAYAISDLSFTGNTISAIGETQLVLVRGVESRVHLTEVQPGRTSGSG